MKRTILSFFTCLFVVISTSAQILRSEELEAYAKEKFGDNWLDAATNLASTLTLDKNNALTFTQVVECPGKSAEQLYILVNYWYSNTFNSGKAVIQLNDKEAGVIIGKGYVAEVASHSGGTNTYVVNLTPIIKTDIKEGKIRITYTVPFYDVDKLAGGGILGALSGVRPDLVTESWVLDKCFPFVPKDKHKRTSAKAFVMAYAYSMVIMDKLEAAVKEGLTGNENDDW